MILFPTNQEFDSPFQLFPGGCYQSGIWHFANNTARLRSHCLPNDSDKASILPLWWRNDRASKSFLVIASNILSELVDQLARASQVQALTTTLYFLSWIQLMNKTTRPTSSFEPRTLLSVSYLLPFAKIVGSLILPISPTHENGKGWKN